MGRLDCRHTRRASRTRFAALAVALAFASLGGPLVGNAHAQLQKWDKDRLVEGLRKQGMTDLLVHLARNEKFDDPTDAARIEVEQLRVIADTGDDQVQRVNACEQAMASLKALIDDKRYTEHPKRPIWQTDYAEIVFMTYLTLKQEAALFYEFGVVTADHRSAYQQRVKEALIYLTEAERQLFKLRSELPRRPDFVEKFQDTQLFERLMEDYDRQRTPFFTAHAAYYTALMPAWSSYMKNLGKEPSLPRQKKTPAEEKKRLFALTLDKVSGFIESNPSGKPVPGILKAMSKNIAARANVMSGGNKVKPGIAMLEELTKNNTGSRNEFIAMLGLAQAYGQVDRLASTRRVLGMLQGHEMARQSLLYKLLLVDLEHNILRDAAKKDPRKVAESYKPYESLLEEHGELAPFVYKRWERQIRPDTKLEDLPGMMLLGVGELALGEGRNLVLEAGPLAQSDPAAADAKLAEAMPKLKRAEELLGTLSKQEASLDSIRAKALFNVGAAIYFQGPQDLQTILRAVGTWIDLGEKFPNEVEASTGMQEATNLLRDLLNQNAEIVKAVMPVFKRAFLVLQKHFPNSAITDNQRAYYVYEVLMPQAKYREAIDVFKKVPETHPTYFDAQAGILESEFKLYQGEKVQSGRTPPQTRLIRLVRDVRGAADSALSAAGDEKPQAPLVATALARLIGAQLAADRKDGQAALKSLQGFEELVAGYDDLIEQGLEFRIKALSTLGRATEADGEAKKMFKQFPNSAVVVIDNVLRDIVREVDLLREQAKLLTLEDDKREKLSRAKNLAATGERLATTLLDWAKGRGLGEDELLTYELILVKSMSLTGNGAEATKRIAKLVEKHPDDAGVIFAQAEALYYAGKDLEDAAKRDESLRAATRIYYRLIEALDPQQNADIKGNRAMLEIWWQSWLRALQILDVRKRNTEAIPDRITHLRSFDQNLGGPVLKVQFQGLEQKYKR